MEVIASYPKEPQATPPSGLSARGLHGVVFSLYELYIDDWLWCVDLVTVIQSAVDVLVVG
jgi:hypothetical protein